MGNKKNIKGSNKGKRTTRKEFKLFSNIANALKAKSEKARKATIVLFVLVLISIITGIFGAYLYQPAKEMYFAENTYFSEIQKTFDYKSESDERKAQEAKVEEAHQVYSTVMEKYTNDTNGVISGYAHIHSNFVKGLIAVAIVLPFLAIAIMFIGSPVNFLFAVANMVIVVPVIVIVNLFKSFRPEKKKEVAKTSDVVLPNDDQQ